MQLFPQRLTFSTFEKCAVWAWARSPERPSVQHLFRDGNSTTIFAEGEVDGVNVGPAFGRNCPQAVLASRCTLDRRYAFDNVMNDFLYNFLYIQVTRDNIDFHFASLVYIQDEPGGGNERH